MANQSLNEVTFGSDKTITVGMEATRLDTMKLHLDAAGSSR